MSFDVTFWFTQVPIKEAIGELRQRVSTEDRHENLLDLEYTPDESSFLSKINSTNYKEQL